jgi:hypothetical protein
MPVVQGGCCLSGSSLVLASVLWHVCACVHVLDACVVVVVVAARAYFGSGQCAVLQEAACW